jgi:CDGSH-type Zn-finger protein
MQSISATIGAEGRFTGSSTSEQEWTMPVEIVATNNGPYLVTGDLAELALRDGAGNLHDLTGKHRIFLCRCGASLTKPFCDGQHSKIGFAAAEAAVRETG